VKQIDYKKDNNILKIEQLSLVFKIRIGVKTPAVERAEVKILCPLITHTCVHIDLTCFLTQPNPHQQMALFLSVRLCWLDRKVVYFINVLYVFFLRVKQLGK
jgi:hypothetical protein